MVEALLKETADVTYEEVVKIPSGVMALVRKSYDTRDKTLDWMLAIAVVATMAYVFREPIIATLKKPIGVNAGRTDLMPNQDVSGAVGNGQPVGSLYTYNMPTARNTAHNVGPTSSRIPFNPGIGGQFNADYEEYTQSAYKGDPRSD